MGEDGFLRALSGLIGNYSYINVSVFSGKSGPAAPNFDVSNLAELDRGRTVVVASGAPATLARTLPRYTGLHKEPVETSIKANSPRREDDANTVLVPVSEAVAANPWRQHTRTRPDRNAIEHMIAVMRTTRTPAPSSVMAWVVQPRAAGASIFLRTSL